METVTRLYTYYALMGFSLPMRDGNLGLDDQLKALQQVLAYL